MVLKSITPDGATINGVGWSNQKYPNTDGGASAGIPWNSYAYQFRPETYGAKGDGVTDDSAAFNAAMTAAVTYGQAHNNYVEILLKPVVYYIAGALNTSHSGRAQIPLPNVPTTAQKLIIVIRAEQFGVGDSDAHWQQTSVQTAGSAILSNLDAAFDSGLGTASVLGGPTVQQVGAIVFSNIHVHISGVQFRSTSNANRHCVVDMQCVANFSFTRIGFSANFTLPGWSQPTNQNSIAIRFPLVGNNDHSRGDSLTIEGYGIGIIPNEHVNIEYLKTISCYTAMFCQQGQADAFRIGYWSCEASNYALDASTIGSGAGNQAQILINLWDIESDVGGELVNHVNDPNNSIYGQAVYEYNAVSGGGTGSTITKNGGTNFRTTNLRTGT